MRVVIFGASGMVGQGVLLECLRDTGVSSVLVIGRSPVGRHDAKLRERLLSDLFDVAAYAEELRECDACFFPLGASSAGMKEAEYRRLTFDLTLAIARELAQRSPQACFVYVSGAGTDSTARGRVMWARVKGETENALRTLPFRSVFLFRPGVIVPLDGIRSKTRMYQVLYSVLNPVLPLLKRAFPGTIVTTRELGQAMLRVASRGWPRPILEAADIAEAARRAGS